MDDLTREAAKLEHLIDQLAQLERENASLKRKLHQQLVALGLPPEYAAALIIRRWGCRLNVQTQKAARLNGRATKLGGPSPDRAYSRHN